MGVGRGMPASGTRAPPRSVEWRTSTSAGAPIVRKRVCGGLTGCVMAEDLVVRRNVDAVRGHKLQHDGLVRLDARWPKRMSHVELPGSRG